MSHTQELENARQAFAATVGTSFDQTAARLSDSVESLGSRLDAWQDAVTRSSLAAASQVEALRDQGETMLRLADQGNQLAGLEDQLCRNLEAIRISETFDQTLHNLTAAVHLLSARAASTGSQRAA